MLRMKKWGWLALSLFVILLDQATKIMANNYLMPYEPVPVIPMFNLTLAYNTGAAFSFLHDAGQWHRWFFVAFSSFASIGLLIWMYFSPLNKRLQLAAISLVLGGALANLIDRAAFGYVVDFIDLYFRSYHWPVFNIADTAICIGAALLILDMALEGQDKEKEQPDD